MTEYHNNIVYITPEYYQELQQEFDKNAKQCCCCSRDEQLFDWVSEELNTFSWRVMGANNLLSQFNKSRGL